MRNFVRDCGAATCQQLHVMCSQTCLYVLMCSIAVRHQLHHWQGAAWICYSGVGLGGLGLVRDSQQGATLCAGHSHMHSMHALLMFERFPTLCLRMQAVQSAVLSLANSQLATNMLSRCLNFTLVGSCRAGGSFLQGTRCTASWASATGCHTVG